ncbi:MAG TPA: WD40 repeat domain-containing protein, partial [Gemmataceae bacterium]|nr:WD40 repeat domain-containing protein [Gemmataceae bacterium]
MARFLLIVCLASAAVASLLPQSPPPAPSPCPVPADSPIPDAPPPRPVKPVPPGFLSRVGVARNTDPPEVAPSLAGYPPMAVRRIVFSHDGRLMLTCGSSPGSSRVWRNLTDPPFAGLDHEETHPARAPHFSPDGRHLVGVSNGRTAVWDAETGVLTQWAPDPAESPSTDRAIGFDPDGCAWAFDSASGTISRQRVADGTVTRTMMGQPMTDFAVLSPNGARLAVGGAAFAVRSTHPDAAWQIVSAQPIRRLRGGRGGRTVTAPIAFSPSGRLLVAGSARGSYLLGQFGIWDVTDRPVAVAEYGPTDSEWLIDAAFSPCGRWIAFQMERP